MSIGYVYFYFFCHIFKELLRNRTDFRILSAIFLTCLTVFRRDGGFRSKNEKCGQSPHTKTEFSPPPREKINFTPYHSRPKGQRRIFYFSRRLIRKNKFQTATINKLSHIRYPRRKKRILNYAPPQIRE